MKRFSLLLKGKTCNRWIEQKKYKTKKGAIDAVSAMRKKVWDIPKYYHMDVIKIIDRKGNSVSYY